jgi:O-antigen ligase
LARADGGAAVRWAPPGAARAARNPDPPAGSRHCPTGRPYLSTGRRLRRKDIFAHAVLAWLALAALPLASNRPFFWAVNGVVAGVLAASYAILAGPARFEPGRRPMPVRLAQAFFLAAIIALALQLVPLTPDLLRTVGVLDPDLGTGAAAVAISVDPGATVAMILRFVTYGLVFLVVLDIGAQRHRAETILLGVLALSVAQAFIGVAWLTAFGDQILLWPKWAYQGFATGTFVNRNSFATYLGFGAAIATTVLVSRSAAAASSQDWPGARRAASWRKLSTIGLTVPALAILATGLVMSGSRMGVASAAGGVVVALILAPAPTGAWRARGLFFLAAGAVAALVLLYSGAGLFGRILALEDNAQVRRDLYAQVVEMIVARPWTGYGGGTFPEAFAHFHRLPLSADVTWDAAHNLYLELLAELGLVAGLLPVLAVGLIAVTLVRAARRSLSSCAALAVVAVGALHSATDFSLQVQANGLVFVVALAVGAAQAGRELAKERQPDPTGTKIENRQPDLSRNT